MLIKKVVFLGIIMLFLVNLSSAQYYYDQSYSYGFFNFGNLDDILYFYESNSGWIDFFIFLIIFLGLSQIVFSQGHFAHQGSKPLSIGISLALSFGLSLWERNTGINLLTFGPFAFLILIILMYYIIFSLLKKMGTEWWVAGAWGYVVVYSLLMLLGSQLLNLVDISSIFPLLNLLFWVCIIVGIIGLFFSRQPARGAP